jgi:ATP-dependent Clp protease ATP-binding subunit ClpA
VRLTYTDTARDWVADAGYDKRFGARPMGRLIDEKIKAQLVDELLFGKLEHGGSVHVDAKDGELTFAFEAAETPPEGDGESGGTPPKRKLAPV